MKSHIKKILRVIRRLKWHLFDPEYLRWIDSDGDMTLRLNYRLNRKSIVFDVGGYHGQWASDIFAKYGSRIFIFEPVDEYAKMITKRFELNTNITAYHFGLGDTSREITISHDEDASSLYRNNDDNEIAKIVGIMDFIRQKKIKKIDLLKINIEGGEYELLDALLHANFIPSIENIQVQFHRCVKDAIQHRQSIRLQLQKTHKVTYDFPFIWENWKKK
ncbi:MAG: FkbM family methyltransferase [Spirochaetes bacterium]|nr:FkbM family methyltransferase [Spirochaetota bacterium]